MNSSLRALATGSGAARWLSCPASIVLSQGIKEPDKPYATAGNKAHEQGKLALIDQIPLEDIEDEAVRVYVETVRTMAGEGEIFVEQRLPLLGSSGQLDVYAIRNRIGYLFDFKRGVGVKLYAEDNEQLAFYGVALKEKYPELKIVYATLIQPAVDGVFEDTPSISSWTLPYQTLAAWRRRFEEGLIEVEKAEKIEAGSWCRFCNARPICSVHTAYAQNAVLAQQFTQAVPALHESHLPETILKVASILKMRKRVETWFEKAHEYLFELAKKGTPVPGFELKPGKSNRQWTETLDKEQIAESLMDRGLKNPWKEKELISFTKAEKLVNINDLVEKPAPNLTLKPIKD